MGSPKAVPDPVDRAFHCQVSHNWKALVKLVFFLFGPETCLKIDAFTEHGWTWSISNLCNAPWPHLTHACAMAFCQIDISSLISCLERSKSQFSNGCSGISVYLSPSACLPSDLVICDVIQSNPSTKNISKPNLYVSIDRSIHRRTWPDQTQTNQIQSSISWSFSSSPSPSRRVQLS